jgi:hypothetical protein
MRASRAILIAILSSSACGGARPAARRAPLRWTDRTFGEQHSVSHERLVLPFTVDPQGTSGTAVVLHLLRAAQARGARYVSDVAIAIQFRRGDTPIECVSRVVLQDAAPVAAAAAAPAPPAAAVAPDPAHRSVEPLPVEPLQVEARVVDRELRCQKQHALVVQPGHDVAEQFESGVGPSDPRPGPSSPKGRLEWQDRCKLEPVERTVRRYDHFVAARMTPPDPGPLGLHADRPLAEAPPACRALDLPPGEPLVHRIEAEVFYADARPGGGGAPRAASAPAPAPLPSPAVRLARSRRGPERTDQDLTGFVTHGDGELRGVVTGPEGRPRAGVEVHILPATGAPRRIVTDRDGRYRADLRGGGAHTVVFVEGPVQIEGHISVQSGETGDVIEIEDTLPPKVLPELISSPDVIPAYSEAAKDRGAWTKAWLMLEVDAGGLVKRVKLLRRPGHDLERAAIDEAFRLRFAPALDRTDRPVRSILLWAFEWPSFWWMLDHGHSTDRLPADAARVPCRGSGGTFKYYRDCSAPDLNGALAAPWIERPSR